MLVQIRPVFQMLGRDVFLPSIYDALLVQRPACHFRDGRVVVVPQLVSFAYELPFHDSYLFGMVHLLPLNYLDLSHTCRICIIVSTY